MVWNTFKLYLNVKRQLMTRILCFLSLCTKDGASRAKRVSVVYWAVYVGNLITDSKLGIVKHGLKTF